MIDLGRRLQKARTGFGLSQEHVAKRLGVSRSAVSQIERGKRKVSCNELEALSMLFGIPTDELLKGQQTDLPSQTFAKAFEELDEADQNEILNLIEFKRTMKVRRAQEWLNYMILSARHSKGNARHWFRFLRKEIDKCGVTFSMDDVIALYNDEALTPFQRVSIKAAFTNGSPTRQHIQSLNNFANRNKILSVRDKYDNAESEKL
ncbi:MAG: helix-turn-helix domain-containing protein [Defluviitaleaceae bacterium]|nr:helix-turn-helix domain-containing protein [Defluviitaleaceae bacterium]